jgi:hypothetical protein
MLTNLILSQFQFFIDELLVDRLTMLCEQVVVVNVSAHGIDGS